MNSGENGLSAGDGAPTSLIESALLASAAQMSAMMSRVERNQELLAEKLKRERTRKRGTAT